jgi:DNA-binding HxlR family transcriptional regulator
LFAVGGYSSRCKAISQKAPSACPVERTIHGVGARYRAMIVFRLRQPADDDVVER